MRLDQPAQAGQTLKHRLNYFRPANVGPSAWSLLSISAFFTMRFASAQPRTPSSSQLSSTLSSLRTNSNQLNPGQQISVIERRAIRLISPDMTRPPLILEVLAPQVSESSQLGQLNQHAPGSILESTYIGCRRGYLLAPKERSASARASQSEPARLSRSQPEPPRAREPASHCQPELVSHCQLARDNQRRSEPARAS